MRLGKLQTLLPPRHDLRLAAILLSPEVRVRLESLGRLLEGDDRLGEAALVRDGGRDLLHR
jgi:hypothetical protein